LIRYLLFQTPGWVIAASVLGGLWYWEVFARWLAVLCFAAWVLKDLLLYPLSRIAYEADEKTGAQRLVGARGVARENLAPEGYVQIHGELWRGISCPTETVIAAGTEIEILDAQGMKVFVRPVGRDA
jgi:membrane protein implicated in regulation of membrane protease activity